MCSPLVKQSPKFLSYEVGHDDRATYQSSQGMGTSNVCVAHTLRLVWRALVCVDMASKHEIERSSMGHMDDVIDISSIYL
jgi:hypothetical protein